MACWACGSMSPASKLSDLHVACRQPARHGNKEEGQGARPWGLNMDMLRLRERGRCSMGGAAMEQREACDLHIKAHLISQLISYHSSSHPTAHLISQLISYHSSSHPTAHLISQLISYHSSSHITAHLISQLISYHISSLISYHSSSHITSLPLLLLQRLDHVPDMLHNSTRPLLAHCIA